jgi:hypothetical protein
MKEKQALVVKDERFRQLSTEACADWLKWSDFFTPVTDTFK